ncbi:MAG: hypothetical protein H6703_09430 [Myxococcales bacterium]|nr:hypothetical protein [Myxococcales bacterium]MCB9542655.1 hypothetical protein [Myxococcales bacterium]
MTDPALDAAVAEAEALLEAGDAVAAAARVEAHEAAVETHERLALLWAALLGAVGDARVLARQLRRLSAAWPRHPVVALRCAAAATRWADPWPATETRDPLAALGADFVARCIDGGGAVDRFVAPLHLALARALARSGPRHDDKALAAFEVALSADPEDARGWADLARFHQQRRRFVQGLGAAREALRHRPDDKPARWTAAVCATALADPGAVADWAALDHLAAGRDGGGRRGSRGCRRSRWCCGARRRSIWTGVRPRPTTRHRMAHRPRPPRRRSARRATGRRHRTTRRRARRCGSSLRARATAGSSARARSRCPPTTTT